MKSKTSTTTATYTKPVTFAPDPEVCNFTVAARFKRQLNPSHPDAGIVIRQLQLTNINGEKSYGHDSGWTDIAGVELASAEKFRCWCLERGNFNFSGGNRELAALINHMCDAMAGKSTRPRARTEPLAPTEPVNARRTVILLEGGRGYGKTTIAGLLNDNDNWPWHIVDVGLGGITAAGARELAQHKQLILCCESLDAIMSAGSALRRELHAEAWSILLDGAKVYAWNIRPVPFEDRLRKGQWQSYQLSINPKQAMQALKKHKAEQKKVRELVLTRNRKQS